VELVVLVNVVEVLDKDVFVLARVPNVLISDTVLEDTEVVFEGGGAANLMLEQQRRVITIVTIHAIAAVLIAAVYWTPVPSASWYFGLHIVLLFRQ